MFHKNCQLLHSHDQLYKHKCRCMRKHNDDTIRTKRHSSLEKYTSHFIERVVCERELETEQNRNILTPTLLAITVFLSRSHSGGCWFSLPHLISNSSDLQLTYFLSSPGLYNNLTPTPASVTISHSFTVKAIIS